MDSSYKRYPGGGGRFNGQILDADGAPTPYAPKWKAYLAADIVRPISSNLKAIAHLGWSHQTRQATDSKIINPTQGFIYAVPGYSLWDARVGIAAEDDAWELSLWGRNLSDKRYVVNATAPTVLTFRIERYGEPRMWGATLKGRF